MNTSRSSTARDNWQHTACILCSLNCGLKVQTENAWFAARPSGTEDVYKIYAESFLGPDHLTTVQAEAKQLVDDVLR